MTIRERRQVGKTRVEAFSDGVIAVIITIMVLELKVPHGDGLDALAGLVPVFVSYVLSFVNVGIYWNNHHHMFHAVRRINGAVMWANSHLLFWLSLVPFSTAWMAENHFAAVPVALYGVVLLMSGFAYSVLAARLAKANGQESTAAAVRGGFDLKGNISLAAYALAIPLALFDRWISFALYVMVAVMWFLPDRRIEKALEHEPPG
jgi:uncharacterized membrane protein